MTILLYQPAMYHGVDISLGVALLEYQYPHQREPTLAGAVSEVEALCKFGAFGTTISLLFRSSG